MGSIEEAALWNLSSLKQQKAPQGTWKLMGLGLLVYFEGSTVLKKNPVFSCGIYPISHLQVHQ